MLVLIVIFGVVMAAAVVVTVTTLIMCRANVRNWKLVAEAQHQAIQAHGKTISELLDENGALRGCLKQRQIEQQPMTFEPATRLMMTAAPGVN